MTIARSPPFLQFGHADLSWLPAGLVFDRRSLAEQVSKSRIALPELQVSHSKAARLSPTGWLLLQESKPNGKTY
jgi:hypothetical protein